jgi:cysteine protease ATG4
MTYRAAFPELATENGDGYVTDTGWGCMVRVGQMFAAHALMRFLKPTSKEQVAEILKLFSDYDDSEMFSIQNIVAVARRDYDLVAGKWYNPSQISYILVDLFRESQERRRFKGFDFLVLNNATLFYDQLVMKMTGRTSICGCKKLKVVCKDCYRLRQSLAVVLLARIGLDQPEKKYLKVLNKMMECKFFLGVLGGKPEKALYFIGRINDNYIYLDPHMVQSGVGHHNFQQSFDSYFCESFRSCRNSSIDPSIGVAFYLETLEDLDEFYDCMSRIKENDPEDFFIFSNL